jgi:hypothetical protein
VADVGPTALDKMASKPTPVGDIGSSAEIFREFSEVWIEKRKQGSKGFLIAAVGGGGHEQQVAVGLLSELRNQLMPLMTTSVGPGGEGASVGLVHDH